MKVWMGGANAILGAGVAVSMLAACSPASRSNTADLNVVRAPQQLQPVQPSLVQQNSLPAIGATGAPAPGLSGTPVLGGSPATSQPMATNSSIVTLGQPAGGGYSVGPEGVWTVSTGTQTCQLNLPLTAKTGTPYYRASAPGCAVPQIASVAGWQQVGSQLQLYDEKGNIAAFLAPSSGRYIGTMGGGQAIAMSR